MGLLVGAFAPHSTPLPASVIKPLQTLVASSTGSQPPASTPDSAGWYLASAPLHDAAARWTGLNGAVAIAGQLLLDTSQDSDTDVLSRMIGNDDALDATLAAACGQFCAALVEPGRRVTLASDRLGIRSLHYGEVDGALVFGSSINQLLTLFPRFAEQADMAGQAQLAALGFTLGDRTAYGALKVVPPGHALVFERGPAHLSPKPRRYASWSRSDPQGRGWREDHAARSLSQAFAAAVERRPASVAYLSGGLDSRCVAAQLARSSREVHTINFAPAGSADLALGALAARALGTRHFEDSGGAPDFWVRSVSSVRAWCDSQGVAADGIRVATGFGGESVLAPTNITEAIAADMRAGRSEAAMERFLGGCAALRSRALQAVWRRALPRLLMDSALEELARYPAADPAQSFHLFLLHNEVRGALARHFADLATRRLHWLLPFLDRHVVAIALQAPTDALLRHRFYYRWLQEFGDAVSAVPWQAYPGSLPCPVPTPPGLRDQWAGGWLDAAAHRADLDGLVARVVQSMRRPGFPDGLLDRRVVWLACLLVRMGVHRFEHVLRLADGCTGRAARIYT